MLTRIPFKIAQAEVLQHQEIASEKREGLVESADSVAVEEAAMEQDAGLPDAARRALATVAKPSQSTDDFILQRVRPFSFTLRITRGVVELFIAYCPSGYFALSFAVSHCPVLALRE